MTSDSDKCRIKCRLDTVWDPARLSRIRRSLHTCASQMFVLNPSSRESRSGGGANSDKIWFFGQLGVYFIILRGAFWFLASPEDRKALAAAPKL